MRYKNRVKRQCLPVLMKVIRGRSLGGPSVPPFILIAHAMVFSEALMERSAALSIGADAVWME